MKLKKYLYKKVESTNNVALRLIKQGNQRGIILTDQQTKGKGQRKNKWISIKGNLFLSVFFICLSLYTIIGTPITGIAVCDAIIPGRCAAPPAPAIITLN